MKRIGILTAGGDTPAMNATIQGAVVRANQLRLEIFGLIKGFNSLFNPRVPHVHLNPLYQEIPEVDPTKGGTMIGSSRDYVDPSRKDELDLIAHRLERLGIEGPGFVWAATVRSTVCNRSRSAFRPSLPRRPSIMTSD